MRIDGSDIPKKATICMNKPKMEPERTPNSLRREPERIPNEAGMDPKRTPKGPGTDPERIPNGPRCYEIFSQTGLINFFYGLRLTHF